jgi:hypothetical protein
MNRLIVAASSALAILMLISGLFATASAAAALGGCGAGGNQSFHGSGHDGSVGVSGECSVRTTDIAGVGGLPVLVIDCGYATATDDHTFWNKACGPTGFPCPAIPGNPSPHQFLTTTAISDPPAPIAQWCAGINTPMPSAAALRDEIIRLLHPPAIGIAPNTGTGLVNLKTLLWINTPSTLNLGRSALIGFPVQLQVTYHHTDFDFGDHTTATLQPTPGTPYHPDHDCGPCTDEFGHTYTHPGPATITAHTYWQAAYRTTGQPWTPIPGTVTAQQPATTTLTIHQAHSILISR